METIRTPYHVVVVEDVGIWKYGAEPGDGSTRTQVDTTGGSGHLRADVEGLAIYYASAGKGYLLASKQGSDEFVVYEREDTNAYVMTFDIVAGGGIDGVTGTDGIDVLNVALGDTFPQGLFLAQDDETPGSRQNFKLVPWELVAHAHTTPLTIDTTSFDPRLVGR